MKLLFLLFIAFMFTACKQQITIDKVACTLPIPNNFFKSAINEETFLQDSVSGNYLILKVASKKVFHKTNYWVSQNCNCKDSTMILWVSDYKDSVLLSFASFYTVTSILKLTETCAIKWHTDTTWSSSNQPEVVSSFNPSGIGLLQVNQFNFSSGKITKLTYIKGTNQFNQNFISISSTNFKYKFSNFSTFFPTDSTIIEELNDCN
jgi:hypothetical protein